MMFAVRVGDIAYIHGGTNTGYGENTAVKFEVLALDFSKYATHNYIKWYKLDSVYPSSLTCEY